MRRPLVHDDRKETQHLLPVGRVFLRREIGQRVRVDARNLNLVEKACQRASEPRGLVHRARARERGAARRLAQPLNQARQHQPALQRRDCVRQDLVVFVAEARLVLVDVAEGANAWQQKRLPRCSAEKGELQRPAGAARWQQDRETTQRQRIAGVERHCPARQEPAR